MDYPNALNSDGTSQDAIMTDIPNYEKKQKIAAAAAATVKDGDFIAISSGSTALFLALLLKNRKELSVVTDSVPVANALIFSAGNSSLYLRWSNPPSEWRLFWPHGGGISENPESG